MCVCVCVCVLSSYAHECEYVLCTHMELSMLYMDHVVQCAGINNRTHLHPTSSDVFKPSKIHLGQFGAILSTYVASALLHVSTPTSNISTIQHNTAP